MPKRKGYIMPELCEYDNIYQGYLKSKHGKTYVHNMLTNKEFNPDEVLNKLQYDFLNGTYVTSDYSVFKIYEPKEREIFRLPYAPDRIAHHCIMNVMEEFWTNKIPNTSYSCVKGRGVHGAYKYILKCLKNRENTKYCFKADIKKFFPNVNHEVLKETIAIYIKDKEFLKILNEIIDSTDGYVASSGNGKLGYNLPIGNYLSQYFANLLVGRAINVIRKEFPNLKIIIYMDDVVVLASNKTILHKFKDRLIKVLNTLDLQLKPNYQIFPVDKQGISFVGFVFTHDRVLLRKKIVKSIYKLCNKYNQNKITKAQFKRSMASYYGWLKYADTKGVCRKIYELTSCWYSNFKGNKVKITSLKNKTVKILHITKHNKYFVIECFYNNKPIEVQSTNTTLLKCLLQLKKNNNYYFTFR